MSDPRERKVTAQDVVDLLNEAARRDAAAMRSLVNMRVSCNSALNAHPTIQVGSQWPDGPMEVGLLGILNGVFGTFANEWGCITAVVDDDPAVPIRFAVVDHSGKP